MRMMENGGGQVRMMSNQRKSPVDEAIVVMKGSVAEEERMG